jgi:hypothetical protein
MARFFVVDGREDGVGPKSESFNDGKMLFYRL